ncbi:MAG TPA: MCE family protein [Marmoricola sp.]
MSARTKVLEPRRRLTGLVTTLVSALALSSCSVYDMPLPGGPDVGDDPITVHVMFRDVLDLVPQSTVKVDDVTVGKVSDIDLNGYTADVTLKLPRSIELPENARAEIRQTSLLGEKFVSLSKPAEPTGKLGDGDTIGLENSGRNPEIEEVFGALALLLNGGGVGQLKTISEELNTAFAGREDSIRSIITQLGSFMGQLDANKESIVTALENVDRLAVELRRQDGTIKSALDELPAAISSVDGQREDLVRMLQALANLSSVGVRVIQASKESTIESLRNLAPVLAAFAKADQNLPKSLQVFLTYPFIDEAVGRDPEVARNLHMGDFTNLSVDLDLDLFDLPSIPGLAPGTSLADVLATCSKSPLAPVCKTVQDTLDPKALEQVCGLPLLNVLCPAGTSVKSGSGGTTSGTTGSGGSGGGLLGDLLGGLGRVAPDLDGPRGLDPFLLGGTGYDPGLGTLLIQGVATK